MPATFVTADEGGNSEDGQSGYEDMVYAFAAADALLHFLQEFDLPLVFGFQE